MEPMLLWDCTLVLWFPFHGFSFPQRTPEVENALLLPFFATFSSGNEVKL